MMTLSRRTALPLFVVYALPFFGYAQDKRSEIEVGVPLMIKINTVDGKHSPHSLLGRSGADVILWVKGSDERAMALQLLGGVDIDHTRYEIDKGHHMRTSTYFVNIGPSVLLHTKWERLHYSLGFGILANAGYGLEESETNYNNTTGTWSVDFDTIDHVIKNTKRAIVPYVSGGALYDVNRHFKVQLSLEQTLLNFYEPGTTIPYRQGYTAMNFNLSSQPLYAGFKLFYVF